MVKVANFCIPQVCLTLRRNFSKIFNVGKIRIIGLQGGEQRSTFASPATPYLIVMEGAQTVINDIFPVVQ